MIKKWLTQCNWKVAITLLGIFTYNTHITCVSGPITIQNLTNKTIYAGMYQYNYERKFNTKVSFATLEAAGSTKMLAPDLTCIAKKGLGDIQSCSSHSRRRLFVSNTSDNNVIQYQHGIIDTSIKQLDPSLWFAQVVPNKAYVVFNNAFFFDPWYATQAKGAGKSDVLSRNKTAYLYPGRLNIIEKEQSRFKAVSRYAEFEQWMTT